MKKICITTILFLLISFCPVYTLAPQSRTSHIQKVLQIKKRPTSKASSQAKPYKKKLQKHTNYSKILKQSIPSTINEIDESIFTSFFQITVQIVYISHLALSGQFIEFILHTSCFIGSLVTIEKITHNKPLLRKVLRIISICLNPTAYLAGHIMQLLVQQLTALFFPHIKPETQLILRSLAFTLCYNFITINHKTHNNEHWLNGSPLPHSLTSELCPHTQQILTDLEHLPTALPPSCISPLSTFYGEFNTTCAIVTPSTVPSVSQLNSHLFQFNPQATSYYDGHLTPYNIPSYLLRMRVEIRPSHNSFYCAQKTFEQLQPSLTRWIQDGKVNPYIEPLCRVYKHFDTTLIPSLLPLNDTLYSNRPHALNTESMCRINQVPSIHFETTAFIPTSMTVLLDTCLPMDKRKYLAIKTYAQLIQMFQINKATHGFVLTNTCLPRTHLGLMTGHLNFFHYWIPDYQIAQEGLCLNNLVEPIAHLINPEEIQSLTELHHPSLDLVVQNFVQLKNIHAKDKGQNLDSHLKEALSVLETLQFNLYQYFKNFPQTQYLLLRKEFLDKSFMKGYQKRQTIYLPKTLDPILKKTSHNEKHGSILFLIASNFPQEEKVFNQKASQNNLKNNMIIRVLKQNKNLLSQSV